MKVFWYSLAGWSYGSFKSFLAVKEQLPWLQAVVGSFKPQQAVYSTRIQYSL